MCLCAIRAVGQVQFQGPAATDIVQIEPDQAGSAAAVSLRAGGGMIAPQVIAPPSLESSGHHPDSCGFVFPLGELKPRDLQIHHLCPRNLGRSVVLVQPGPAAPGFRHPNAMTWKEAEFYHGPGTRQRRRSPELATSERGM